MKKIYESKDVGVYKQLLKVLGDYIEKNPVTGVNKLFDLVIEQGKKILPKDKIALAVLSYVLSDTAPIAVQKLLNTRLGDLPKIEFRPVIKVGKKHEVAFWCQDGQVHDKVKDLINFDGSSKAGYWSDIEGNKVTLLDLSKEEK